MGAAESDTFPSRFKCPAAPQLSALF
eukprot:COSAG03_NODE_20204_length_323_cov_0.625000_1_plen_25_part_01